MRSKKPDYLEGCKTLPNDLAVLVAHVDEPTKKEAKELRKAIRKATRDIRKRRAKHERENGPIEWDD